MRRTTYDGPLSSATVPDGGGRQRTCHGAASLGKRPGRLYAAPGRPLRPDSSGAARGGLAFRASPRPPEGSLGGEDTTTIRAPPGQTTALKARRDVYVLWLQRWRRGWWRSLPAVDVKWVAGARDENGLHMIDRRRPRPWTHAEEHEIINQDLLIIGGRCVLLVGNRGVGRCACRFVRSPQHVQDSGSGTTCYGTRQARCFGKPKLLCFSCAAHSHMAVAVVGPVCSGQLR